MESSSSIESSMKHVNKRNSLISKHSYFVKGVYQITLTLMSVYVFFQWLVVMFDEAHKGNVLGFIFLFVTQTLWMGLFALIGTAIWGTLALIILFIPYLIVRGLWK